MSSDTNVELAKIWKKQTSVNNLLLDHRRDPVEFGRVMDLIIQNRGLCRIKYAPIFLDMETQLGNFLTYNFWLKAKYPKYQIADKEIIKLIDQIQYLRSSHKAQGKILIFYCHNSDVMLTGKLAWRFMLKNCKKSKSRYAKDVWFARDFDDFSKNYLLDKAEKKRPTGFYFMRTLSGDRKGLGTRFMSKIINTNNKSQLLECSDELIEKLRQKGSWGMASEGLQFFTITHPDYYYFIDGINIPHVVLPGYEKKDEPKHALKHRLWVSRSKTEGGLTLSDSQHEHFRCKKNPHGYHGLALGFLKPLD